MSATKMNISWSLQQVEVCAAVFLYLWNVQVLFWKNHRRKTETVSILKMSPDDAQYNLISMSVVIFQKKVDLPVENDV